MVLPISCLAFKLRSCTKTKNMQLVSGLAMNTGCISGPVTCVAYYTPAHRGRCAVPMQVDDVLPDMMQSDTVALANSLVVTMQPDIALDGVAIDAPAAKRARTVYIEESIDGPIAVSASSAICRTDAAVPAIDAGSDSHLYAAVVN